MAVTLLAGGCALAGSRGLSNAPTSPTAAATSPTTAATSRVPPKPLKTTYKQVKVTPLNDQGVARATYRLTWVEPDGYASSFRVYGVTECLRESPTNADQPCVLEDTPIPHSALKLLRTVSGTTRSTKITLDYYEIGPGPYAAILLQGVGKDGYSSYAVVYSDRVCGDCVY
jgi:hypothetical protein